MEVWIIHNTREIEVHKTMKMWLIKQLYSNLFTSLQLMVWSLQTTTTPTPSIDSIELIGHIWYMTRFKQYHRIYNQKTRFIIHIYISTTKQFRAASLLHSLRRNRWPEIWRMTCSLIRFRPMTNSTKCLDQIHRHKELLYILRFWKPSEALPKGEEDELFLFEKDDLHQHRAIRIQTSGKPISYISIFHVPKEARERMTVI